MRDRIVLVLALLVAVGGTVWGVGQSQTRAGLQNALEANYQREFYALLNQVEQVKVLLGKAQVATSPRHNVAQLTEIWSRAGAAQESLAKLPFPNINLAASRKFLAQTGDYSYALARRASRTNKPLSDGERHQLGRFEDEMGRLASRLHGLESSLADRRFRWTTAAPGVARSVPRRPATRMEGATARAEEDRRDGPPGAGDLDGFGDVEKRLQQLPSLTYDGPFSDHLERRKPVGVRGKMITPDEAVAIARRFADLDGTPPFRAVGRPRATGGHIPAYLVTLQGRQAPERITVNVSRRGGHVAWMLSSRTVGSARMAEGEARRKAEAFLAGRGYKDLEMVDSLQEENTRVFSFAARQGNAILYPDQVKVKVAMDNGRVLAFDGRGYLTNHQRRNLPEPKVTAEEARRKVDEGMNPARARLAVIPTDGGREVLAWEVRGQRGDTTYLIYINARDGEEESILQMVDTPQGRLGM